MNRWKLLPRIDNVSKYVECYWFLEKQPHDQIIIYPKLNPNPSSHLIISDLNRSHEYKYSSTSQKVIGSHWIYPHLKTFTMDHAGSFKIIGIKFRIGALYSLNLRNLSSYIDNIQRVDTNSIFGSESFNTNQLLINASKEGKKVCNMLDETLFPWLLDCHEDKHSDLVRQILPLLKDTPITQIGEKLRRSQRTTERSFKRVTGLSMKQVQSMNRIEEVLNYLYQLGGRDINWADVASKYDFSDQPHLIRHLKGSIGSTPSDYEQRRDLTIDIYGDFESK